MADTMIILTAPSPMMPLVCSHHMDDRFTPTILTSVLVSLVLDFYINLSQDYTHSGENEA
jgi:hypothetical protein